MKTYYFELEEEVYNPNIEVDGTIRARNNEEAVNLCKAIAERHNLPLNFVGVRMPDLFDIFLHKCVTVFVGPWFPNCNGKS